MDDVYAFIDNSFLFIEGYKHVRAVTKLPPNKKPYIDYRALRTFIQKEGNLKRVVLVGSNLAGNLISGCQLAGFEVFTFPRYPDIRTGKDREKGIDQKIGWEVAKTIFTNKDTTANKKILLCTGDKDFMAVLPDIQTANWAFELWVWKNCCSPKYTLAVEVLGKVRLLDAEWKYFIKIGDV
jgi:hypothetical protein